MGNKKLKVCEHHGITDDQMKFLWWAIKEMRARGWKPITYVEIGVFYGGVFRRVLEQLTEDGDFAYGMDLFEQGPEHTKGNTHVSGFVDSHVVRDELAKRGFTNFMLFVGDSAETVPQLPPIRNGLIVIDGNHTFEATKKDFINIYEKMENGFIFFHDTDWAGPDRVTREIVQKEYGLPKIKENRGARLYERR